MNNLIIDSRKKLSSQEIKNRKLVEFAKNGEIGKVKKLMKKFKFDNDTCVQAHFNAENTMYTTEDLNLKNRASNVCKFFETNSKIDLSLNAEEIAFSIMNKIENKDVEGLKKILKSDNFKKKKLGIRQEYMQNAIRVGALDVFHQLIISGGEVKPDLLLYAAQEGNVEICKFLLEKGVPIDTANNNGGTAFYIACMQGKKNVVELFLNNKQKPNLEAKQKLGFTPLFISCLNGHFEILKILLEHGADEKICVENPEFPTLLHAAAHANRGDIYSFLIDRGLKPDVANKLGEFPIHIGCRRGFEEIVQISLDKDNSLQESGDVKPLALASMYGHMNIVKFLVERNASLESKSSFISTKDEDWTPLMFAAEGGKSEIFAYLIENKADVNARSKKKFTVLHATVVGGNLNDVNLLLTFGAKVNELDICGWTPLHLAISKGFEKIVNVLRKKGANMNQRLPNNASPLELAKVSKIDESSRSKIIKIIDQKKCVICDQTANIKTCSRCRKVYYCGKEHQLQDWKDSHKDRCNN